MCGISSGTIGTVNHVRVEMDEDYLADATAPFTWKSEKAAGYGALDDFGVHPLSLLWVLFGNNLVCEGYSRLPDAVYYDDAEAGRRMVERLISMGHRDIWFAGDVNMPWFRRRSDSYRGVMRSNGLEPRANRARITLFKSV